MEVSSTQYKHCSVVKIIGRVDSATAPKMAEKIEEITNASTFNIVLDLSEVEFMSSAGLRVMINTQKTCKRYNRGEVVLASVPENIYSALDLAGFTTLFKIFDDVLAAVGNF